MRRARHDRDAELLCESARTRLVAEQIQHFRCGPDEADAVFRASTREIGVLAQEAVAGVNRIASALACD